MEPPSPRSRYCQSEAPSQSSTDEPTIFDGAHAPVCSFFGWFGPGALDLAVIHAPGTRGRAQVTCPSHQRYMIYDWQTPSRASHFSMMQRQARIPFCSRTPRRDLAQTCIRWRDLLELDLEPKGPIVVLPPLIRRRESQFAPLATGMDDFRRRELRNCGTHDAPVPALLGLPGAEVLALAFGLLVHGLLLGRGPRPPARNRTAATA